MTASPTPSPSAHLAGHWAWCEVPGATADTRFDRWTAPVPAQPVARPCRRDRRRRDRRARRDAPADDLPPRRSRTARSGRARRGAVPRQPARRLRRASRTENDAATGARPRTRRGGAAAPPAGRRPGRRHPRRHGVLAEPLVHGAVPAPALGRELSGPDARPARRVPGDGPGCRSRVRGARRRDPGGPDRRAGSCRARRIGGSGLRRGVRVLPDTDDRRAGPVFSPGFDPGDA